MKNLTDFRKTVETGVDPRLPQTKVLGEQEPHGLYQWLRGMAWKHSFGPQEFFAFAALGLLLKPCWQGSLAFPSSTFLQLENSLSFPFEKAASFLRILSNNFCKVSFSCFAS